MKSISATDQNNGWQHCWTPRVAVVMSAEECQRIHDLSAAEFQRFCDRVGVQAKARGSWAAITTPGNGVI